MTSLAESNKYLKDKKKLQRMIQENTYDSAVFEGASPRSVKPSRSSASTRRKTAASKKAAKSS